MIKTNITVIAAMALGMGVAAVQFADAHGKKEHTPGEGPNTTLRHMRDLHQGHDHQHDFEAMQALSPEQMQRMMLALLDIGLVVPGMDSHNGRELFLQKGCIVCHQVNGVGGDIGPSLNAADMPAPMNAFEFAARMWRGAGAMTQMQEELFGGQIELTGQDLADLVAFAHDRAEQEELTDKDIPPKFRNMIQN